VTDQELVDALDEVWGSTAAVGAELSEAEWNSPTDCPGWTAQDVLAHVIGIEETILGHPAPEVDVPDSEHLKNDFARSNEVWVESMRTSAGADVLARFSTVTGERLAGLRALDATGFDADSWTPAGRGTVRDLLPFRIFDSWVHEQDIRRAVEHPGGLDGIGASLALDRCVSTMGYVVGKKVAPPEGTTLVFDLGPPLPARFGLVIEAGRAVPLDAMPGTPTVTIGTTGETFVRLACGRIGPARADLTIDGDPALGAAVVANLNFLF